MNNYVVYMILNIQSNKIYIGQTCNFKSRCRYHKNKLAKGIHDNPKLQIDYNLLGSSSFVFRVIEQNLNRDKSLERESYWINYYGGIESDNVYNEWDLSGRSVSNKLNISKSKQRVKLDNNACRNIAKGHKNLIPWNKNKSMTDSFKKLQHTLNKGKNNPMYGKSTKKKYDQLFIDNLKEDYDKIQNIAELARTRNMNENVVRCLILYGKSYKPRQD